jgi:hypothetical protein
VEVIITSAYVASLNRHRDSLLPANATGLYVACDSGENNVSNHFRENFLEIISN